MTDEHRYSTFALDLHWAEPSPDVQAHVAECERCSAYLAHLGELDARPFALPVARPRRRFVIAFAFAALALALVLLVWRRDSRPAYVATKSAPAVQVLLRRDGRLSVWNGSDAIRPRDTLALRLACEAMTRVVVLVRDRDQWTQAFDGPCLDEVLPFTLVVDDEPGDERIAVLLSASTLDQASVVRAIDLQTQRADVWALQYVFTKETRE